MLHVKVVVGRSGDWYGDGITVKVSKFCKIWFSCLRSCLGNVIMCALYVYHQQGTITCLILAHVQVHFFV